MKSAIQTGPWKTRRPFSGLSITWIPKWTKRSQRGEPLLFHGLLIVPPTLLGLATELALKALHIREGGARPKSHDLLELFASLPERMRRRLHSKMPSVPEIHPSLPSVYPGIREVLQANRTVFVEWRYLHERIGGHAETSTLKEALSAIIDAFEERTPSPALSLPDAGRD